MGKAENIKRMKRLKEEKARRERANSPELYKKQDKSDIVDSNRPLKFSELLQQFIEPILEHDDDLESLKGKISLGILAWNSAVVKSVTPEEHAKTIEVIRSKIAEDPVSLDMFNLLIERKESEFSEYINIFESFEVKKLKGRGYFLTVEASFYAGK